MRYNHVTDTHPFLYHSPRRPAWLGLLGQIKDRAGVTAIFAATTNHTFTVACDGPLSASVADSFELEAVHYADLCDGDPEIVTTPGGVGYVVQDPDFGAFWAVAFVKGGENYLGKFVHKQDAVDAITETAPCE